MYYIKIMKSDHSTIFGHFKPSIEDFTATYLSSLKPKVVLLQFLALAEAYKKLR
jgi:hypothetical protein